MDPTPPQLPAGFQPASNATFGQNPTTGDVAHLDPITNTWVTTPAPADFVPDPSAQGSLTYVNPATGQQLQFTGYNTWMTPGDTTPPVFHYDPASGQTAYRDSRTGTWSIVSPPEGYVVDQSQPPSRLGFFFVKVTDTGSTTAFFDGSGPGWTDADTYKPLPPTTQERPGTSVRVPVPDNLPPVQPDTPQQALIHDPIWLKRMNALQKGDLTVPTGTPARDFVADMKNLDETVALRDQMIRDGQTDLRIVNNHILDLQRYLIQWDDFVDDKGHFVHGGATEVNDAAQGDDLGSSIKLTGEIFDQGVGMAGGELVANVTKFIQTTGIGGGGSQTVVPTARTAKEFVTRQRPVGPLVSGGGQPVEEVPPPPLPPSDGRSGTGTEPGTLRAPQVEMPSATSETLMDGDIVRTVAENEAGKREFAANIYDHGDNVETELIDPVPGETRGQAIDRYGREHSLDDTFLDPGRAGIKMKALRRDLGEVLAGTSETIQRTPENVRRLAIEYRAAQHVIEQGESLFDDYWERMPPDTARLVRTELDLSTGKDPAFWRDLFNDTVPSTTPAAGGDPGLAALVAEVNQWITEGRYQGARPPAVDPKASTNDLPGAVDPKASTGDLPLPPTNALPGNLRPAPRALGGVARRWLVASAAAALIVGIGGLTALGIGPFAGTPAAVVESPGASVPAPATQPLIGETQAPATEVATSEPSVGVDLGKVHWTLLLQAGSDQVDSHCRILVRAEVRFQALGSDAAEDQALIDAVVGKTATVTMSGPGLPHQVTVDLSQQGSNYGVFGDITAATGGATYQETLVTAAGVPLNLQSQAFVNPCQN